MDDEDQGADEPMSEVGYGKPPRHTRFKPGNVPHNKRPLPDVDCITDVVDQVLSEPRKVMKNGKLQKVTLAERAIRLDIGKAVGGNAAAIRRLVKLMLKYPKLSRSYRDKIRVIIGGTDALA